MTTSATKGKAAREVAHDWFPANCLFGTTRVHSAVCDRVTEMLEARDTQQAAIHEEELMEARELLGRWILVWEQGASAAGLLPAATRDFLGASRQTGTPHNMADHVAYVHLCDHPDCKAEVQRASSTPAGSGTAETCAGCDAIARGRTIAMHDADCAVYAKGKT